MNINISESYDSFRELRQNNAYYVDKSLFLKQYLSDNFKKAVLFARPRRFGKTLAMTMFRDFLDIRQDSRDIFDGLKIMEEKETVEKYMNKFPVIFVSLKEVFGNDFNEVLQNLRIVFSRTFENYSFLLESEKVSVVSRDMFNKIWRQEADQSNTERALDLLCQMLRQHFDTPAFVIIDEYDVPMAKTMGTEAYDRTRDMVEHMLSYVCKTNENVKAVLLSGCLFTVKNSTYTGVNNIIPYTVLSANYASAFGFTDNEVRELLYEAGLSDRYDAVKEWYDGYIFGNERLYCPWDVLRYVGSVLDGSYNENMGPESYWVNSSETDIDIIRGFLGKTSGILEDMEQLLAGKNIDCAVKDTIPYHRIHESGENIWSALVETGYLTKAMEERYPVMPLRIPNKGIKDVFRQEIWEFFKKKVENSDVRDLVNSLWAGESEKAERALALILEATLSYFHEYHEYSYHLILDGFFTGVGYKVLSEEESGYGRTDLVVLDPARKRCLLIELKHVKQESELDMAITKATSQIVDEKYDSTFEYLGYKTRLRYSMAFWNKKVKIEKV